MTAERPFEITLEGHMMRIEFRIAILPRGALRMYSNVLRMSVRYAAPLGRELLRKAHLYRRRLAGARNVRARNHPGEAVFAVYLEGDDLIRVIHWRGEEDPVNVEFPAQFAAQLGHELLRLDQERKAQLRRAEQ